MQYQCPNCSDLWEVDTADGSARCPRCSARMHPKPVESQATPESPPATALEQQPLPIQTRRLPALRRGVLPIAVSTKLPELVEEKIEDLRDRRDHRRERRQFERDDRSSNRIGTAGLAMNATALLLLTSGAVFAADLKVYAWIVTLLAIPMVLVGLPCSFVGALRVGRPQSLSWIGVGLGALLLLVLIPVMFLKIL